MLLIRLTLILIIRFHCLKEINGADKVRALALNANGMGSNFGTKSLVKMAPNFESRKNCQVFFNQFFPLFAKIRSFFFPKMRADIAIDDLRFFQEQRFAIFVETLRSLKKNFNKIKTILPLY